MSWLPIISSKITIKAFGRLGYVVDRKRGSHYRLLHKNKKPLTIPSNKVIGKGLLRKLIRDAEISVEQFKKLL